MTNALSSKKREKLSSLYQQLNPKDSLHRMGLSAINMNEAEQEYILYATATGLRREDFYVSVNQKIVTIVAGGKEADTKGTTVQTHAEQVRTFVLPDDADPLLTAATYNDGSLEIHIPKGQNSELKPVLIHVY